MYFTFYTKIQILRVISIKFAYFHESISAADNNIPRSIWNKNCYLNESKKENKKKIVNVKNMLNLFISIYL